jgi:hypothetical protein
VTLLATATGGLLAGLRASPDQWGDSFHRPDGPLGNGWIDGHDWDPDVYEPVGILDESAVCTNPRSRSGTYAPDQTVHPVTPPGTLYQGIGCAWQDFGTDVISVTYRYSGIWTPPTHVEGGPLLHVVPGTNEHGYGAWLTYFSGIPLLAVGAIRNPPEDWGANPSAGDFAVVSHTEGVPRSIELRSNGTGVTAWLDGTQISMNTHGLDPVPIPVNLLGSTLHGFCVDTHLTTQAAIPTTPVLHSVTVTT